RRDGLRRDPGLRGLPHAPPVRRLAGGRVRDGGHPRARRGELSARRGAPCGEISRRGGGIAASARALAEASDEEVLAQAGEVRVEMLEHGTTTVEARPGYGSSRDGELRAARLGRAIGDRVTGLFAHAIPP